MIEIGHENNRRAYCAHKGMLSLYSGYFTAALSDSWRDTHSGVLKLESEDADLFGAFVLWLYSGKITDGSMKVNQGFIVDIWLFADRRNIPLLMNEMVDELHRSIGDNWTIPAHRLHTIYEHTPERSALRRLLMYSMCRLSGPRLLGTKVHTDEFPREAMVNLLRLMLAIPREPHMMQWEYNPLNVCSAYHTHEEGVSCKIVTSR